MPAIAEQPLSNETMIEAGLIDPGPNDRKVFNAAALRDLAESIASDGLAQPPLVRPIGGRYEIVCGERRFRAMTEVLGWEHVPVRVRPMTDYEASALMLAENTARDDLDPIAEGEAYIARMEQWGLTIEAVARQVGVPVGRARARVTCAQRLSEAAKQDYIAGVLSHQHALDLCRIEKANQKVFLEKIRLASFNAHQWRELISKVKTAQNEDAAVSLFGSDDFALRVEEFVEEVRAKTVSTKSYRRDLIARLAAASSDPALANEARDFLASTY